MLDFSFPNWQPQAYGIWTGVIMFAGWLLRELRETRKLSTEDRQARREGFAHQVEGLQVENRNLRLDLSALRHEYDDYRRLCHHETDELRGQVVELSNELTGLKRRLDSQSVAVARQIRDNGK